MDRSAIEQILPHRAPMLLLDQVELEGEEAVGTYTVPADAFYLQGHFPGNPIVPGVILCEILAQSACVLLQGQLPPGAVPMYTGLNHVKFRSPVLPGQTLQTRCRILRSKGPFYFCQGTLQVGQRLCMQGEFSFAITGV